MALFPDSVIKHSVELYTSRISAKSKTIYWLIIISICISITILPFVYVDISVQARGVFQSSIEKQNIASPGHGRVVITSITLGGTVKSGDTLFMLDPGALEAQISSLTELKAVNEAFVHDLEFLTGLDDFTVNDATQLRSPHYRSELASFLRNYETHKQRLERSENEYVRNRTLFEKQVIAETEYNNYLNDFSMERRGLDQLIAFQLAGWQNDLSVRREDTKRISTELLLRKEELKNRVVTSPIDGTIIHSIDIQIGTHLAPGQVVAEVSPDSEIVAVFFISPADIGFVKAGQEIRFQVDAYNYHQWGTLEGRVSDISGDLIYDGSSAYFRVRSKPEGNTLSLKNGISSDVIKGMTFTARITVTRRTLLQLLFDRADKWFNPYNNNGKIDHVS